jgi:hypothetical protein
VRRLTRLAGLLALLGVLALTGCERPDPPAAPAGTSADPLSDVQSTVDAVQHELDTDDDS